MTDRSVNPGEGCSQTSLTLLVRAKAQDPAAWQRLIDLYLPLVYRWCRLAGLQAADAADVGQEVFQAVARKLADFHRSRDGDTFRGWLRTITRNKVRDHFRNLPAEAPGGSQVNHQQDPVPAPDDSSEAGRQALSAEAQLIYRRAIELIRSEFEESSWQAFWQRVVENRPSAEVAANLGMTINAVNLAKSRILHRLRQEFQDLVDPDLL